jgi:hypothetical protein
LIENPNPVGWSRGFRSIEDFAAAARGKNP